MPVTLSIKNAPDHIVQRLRQRAEKNHRSLQGELMVIIEDAVKPNKISPLELLVELRKNGVNSPDEATAMVRADRDRDELR